MQEEVLLLTFDLDIRHLWVDTEGQVAGQCPGCGRPGNQGHLFVFHQREVNDDGWILDVLEERNGAIEPRMIDAFCASLVLRRSAPTL